MPSWLKFLLIAIGLVLFVIRGGFMVLVPLLRFAIPALVIYGVYYLIKSHFKSKKSIPKDDRSRVESDAQTIEICGHCGREVGTCKDCPIKKTF